jgi:hypothetical protein
LVGGSAASNKQRTRLAASGASSRAHRGMLRRSLYYV